MQLELDEHRESKDPTPVEDLPAQPQPSAFPTKSTKRTKPSKKILSQTVVYKEKEKAPKSEQKSPEHQEETEDDLVVSSPTPIIETAKSGEEQMPVEGEGTEDEMLVTEEKVEDDNDLTTEVTRNGNDGETEPAEEGDTGKGQEKDTKKEQEKEEQEQEQEEVKKVVPKSELIINKIRTE